MSRALFVFLAGGFVVAVAGIATLLRDYLTSGWQKGGISADEYLPMKPIANFAS